MQKDDIRKWKGFPINQSVGIVRMGYEIPEISYYEIMTR